MRDAASSARAHTTLAVPPPATDDDARGDGPTPSLTTRDVADEVSLDRRWARKHVGEYSDRGIGEDGRLPGEASRTS